MLNRQAGIIAATLLLGMGVAGCDGANEGASDIPQTKFPGQATAGGGTSGEVMAQNGTLQAKKDPQGTPMLVPMQTEQKPAAGGASAAGTGAEKPAGTPGIPEGSGGTTSGTAMGGTTPGAAEASQGAADTEAEAKAKVEREKQQLAASMDAVAQRWRETATARGWVLESGADNSSSGVSSLGQTETSAIGLPTVIRSEKLGTAPPSEDVKQPERDPSN